MSSGFFKLAQSISSTLVEFLPPEYDSSVDVIETTHVEGSHDIQRLFRKNRNHMNGVNFQQIHDVRITTPEWLRHAKNEFYENQNKRDKMGLHVLAIARRNECDRALRLLHARQSWSNNNNNTPVCTRNIRVKDRGRKKDANLITSRVKQRSTSSVGESLSTGRKSSLRSTGGKILPNLEIMYHKRFLNGSESEEESEEETSMDFSYELSEQSEGSDDMNNFMQATNDSVEYETECEEEEVLLTSQQGSFNETRSNKSFQQVTRDDTHEHFSNNYAYSSFNNNNDNYLKTDESTNVRRKPFPLQLTDGKTRSGDTFKNPSYELSNLFEGSENGENGNNFMQATNSDIIQLEYETECEEEEVLLTSQQESFNETRSNKSFQQVVSTYSKTNDNYLDFVIGLNNGFSISTNENLNYICEEKNNKEYKEQQTSQIISCNNTQALDDNESIYNSSLNFTLQELIAFVNNSSIDQYGQTDLSTNLTISPSVMYNDFPTDYFNYDNITASTAPLSSISTLFEGEDEIPLDLMFTNIGDIELQSREFI